MLPCSTRGIDLEKMADLDYKARMIDCRDFSITLLGNELSGSNGVQATYKYPPHSSRKHWRSVCCGMVCRTADKRQGPGIFLYRLLRLKASYARQVDPETTPFQSVARIAELDQITARAGRFQWRS